MRRDIAIGVLLAGTRAGAARFADRGRELARGVAQHVAIALNNVRLVSDLRHAHNLKTEFLSTMSHELRTPLNVIIGYADLLRDEAFGPVIGDQRDVLRRSRNAHSLLGSSMRRRGTHRGRQRLQLKWTWTFLTELQYETERYRQQGVALRWELPRGSDHPYRSSLKIVVRSLVGNAWVHQTRSRHRVVLFDARPHARRPGARHGVGIPASTAASSTCSAGADRRGTSGGLGLYIVRRFVDSSAAASAATAPATASIFRLSLPAGVTQPQLYRWRRPAEKA